MFVNDICVVLYIFLGIKGRPVGDMMQYFVLSHLLIEDACIIYKGNIVRFDNHREHFG